MRSGCVWGVVGGLVPDAQERVPGAGGDGHAVLGDAQARHAVVVTSQDAWNRKCILRYICLRRYTIFL